MGKTQETTGAKNSNDSQTRKPVISGGPTRKNGRWQWTSAMTTKKFSREKGGGGVLLGTRTDDRDGDHGRDDYPPPHDHGNDGSPGRTIPRRACVCIDAGRVCALRRRALRRGVGGDMRERLDRGACAQSLPPPPNAVPAPPYRTIAVAGAAATAAAGSDGWRSTIGPSRSSPQTGGVMACGKSSRSLEIFFFYTTNIDYVSTTRWRLRWSMCKTKKKKIVLFTYQSKRSMF